MMQKSVFIMEPIAGMVKPLADKYRFICLARMR